MFRSFFSGIPAVIASSYAHGRWIWHALAALATALIVFSGTDWAYYIATRPISHYGIGAAIAGFFVPILAPIALYTIGELRHRGDLMSAAATIAKAEITGLAISSFYKFFTGRTQPEFYTFTSSVDSSHDFQFGFFRHGIFWGWPSSHAAVAFAGAIALMLLFPKNRAVRYLTPLYLLAITIGVSISIHWLSDTIAGAIIGTAVALGAAELVRTRNAPIQRALPRPPSEAVR